MLWVGLGKVAVATAGVPVPLSTLYAPTLKVNTVMVTYDPADGSSTVIVKDRAGNIMANMSSVQAPPTVFTAPGGDQLDLRDFQIDVASGSNGKGPTVALGIN
jgi:hypothetical protein